MKLIVSFAVVLVAVGGAVVGCGGSPSITCQTQMCGTDSSKSYKACSHVDGTVSYDFGGMSCDCKAGDQTGCNSCAAEVANYCAGGGIGGTGGTGGGGSGGGGGGGNVTCTATFSGAFSATYMPCAVTITVAGGTWTLGTAGNALPGTPYTWTGTNMNFTGTNPAPGTYDQTMSQGSSSQVTLPGSTNPPVWEAGYGQSTTIGSASVTITSLGPSTNVNGNPFYQQPHGTYTATLPDTNTATHMPDLMMSMTF